MKRKILAALLSGVMVLSLAACTSGTSSSEGGGDGEGSSESEEASGALTSFESDKEDGFVVGFSTVTGAIHGAPRWWKTSRSALKSIRRKVCFQIIWFQTQTATPQNS